MRTIRLAPLLALTLLRAPLPLAVASNPLRVESPGMTEKSMATELPVPQTAEDDQARGHHVEGEQQPSDVVMLTPKTKPGNVPLRGIKTGIFYILLCVVLSKVFPSTDVVEKLSESQRYQLGWMLNVIGVGNWFKSLWIGVALNSALELFLSIRERKAWQARVRHLTERFKTAGPVEAKAIEEELSQVPSPSLIGLWIYVISKVISRLMQKGLGQSLAENNAFMKSVFDWTSSVLAGMAFASIRHKATVFMYIENFFSRKFRSMFGAAEKKRGETRSPSSAGKSSARAASSAKQ